MSHHDANNSDANNSEDNSSQDPAQPPVGPAIQFEKLVVPDDQPVSDAPPPPGELIDLRREEIAEEAR